MQIPLVICRNQFLKGVYFLFRFSPNNDDNMLQYEVDFYAIQTVLRPTINLACTTKHLTYGNSDFSPGTKSFQNSLPTVFIPSLIPII